MNTDFIQHTTNSEFNLIEKQIQLDWLNWIVILLCLISIIVSRVSDYSYIQNLFKRNNNFNTNAITLKKLSSLSLLFNYYLIISLFIWQYIIITNNNLFSQSVLFFILITGVISLSVFKFIIIFIIDTLFLQRNHFHIKLHLSYYQILGIVLVPLYILSYKLDMFLTNDINKADVYVIFAVIVVLITVIREIKSLFTALKNRISLFYIILYLCTLEILPLILAIKILKG